MRLIEVHVRGSPFADCLNASSPGSCKVAHRSPASWRTWRSAVVQADCSDRASDEADRAVPEPQHGPDPIYDGAAPHLRPVGGEATALARDGTALFAASIGAALFAGAALHALYPELVDGGIWQEAWARSYSGGSAGAVGLVGAAAAGMRKPAILLGLFVAWEVGIGVGHFGITRLSFIAGDRVRPRDLARTAGPDRDRAVTSPGPCLLGGPRTPALLFVWRGRCTPPCAAR